MGNPPDWTISKDFGEYPVVISKTAGVWQGYRCGSTTLTELRPDGPFDLAQFHSDYSNSGAIRGESEPESVDGEVGNIVAGKSFEVRYYGTRSFVHRYVRKGETFVLTDDTDPGSVVPTC